MSGDRYPDLETVQRLALAPLTGNLADMLRDLLAADTLTIEAGRIIISAPPKGAAEQDG